MLGGDRRISSNFCMFLFFSHVFFCMFFLDQVGRRAGDHV